MRIIPFLLLIVLLSSCELKPPEPGPLKLHPAEFSALPGWAREDFSRFTAAFKRSCERILKRDPSEMLGPLPAAGTYGEWQPLCREFQALEPKDTAGLRAFFEQNFRPFLVTAGDEARGLFTGYYEASLRGSRTKSGPYRIPLYARPDDLVMVHLGQFRDHLKGERIAGRVIGGTLKPYESRAEIVAGDWPHNDKVLLWVDDPVDAFFVQIQGSGVVELPDGGQVRIGYAGQNGHPYYAIGRELIKRGALTRENVSMQAIRGWLEANPAQADEIMNTNRSYVFFRILEGEGPLGGEGVPLTPGRSLAVDRTEIPYGIPMWAAPSAARCAAMSSGATARPPSASPAVWPRRDVIGCYYLSI